MNDNREPEAVAPGKEVRQVNLASADGFRIVFDKAHICKAIAQRLPIVVYATPDQVKHEVARPEQPEKGPIIQHHQ